MAYRLCNPTPFEARIAYEPGRPIVVPGDSEIELSHDQGDHFRLDKPGTQGMLDVIQPLGIFLRDDTRNYDTQALAALRTAARMKRSEYHNRVENLKNLKSEQGVLPDSDSMDHMIKAHGLNKLLEEAIVCEKRAEIIAKAVEGLQETVRSDYDPERTCFVLETGPKEFPSKLALQLFLEENPEVKKRHLEYSKE